jgi:hypothetical protein
VRQIRPGALRLISPSSPTCWAARSTKCPWCVVYTFNYSSFAKCVDPAGGGDVLRKNDIWSLVAALIGMGAILFFWRKKPKQKDSASKNAKDEADNSGNEIFSVPNTNIQTNQENHQNAATGDTSESFNILSLGFTLLTFMLLYMPHRWRATLSFKQNAKPKPLKIK